MLEFLLESKQNINLRPIKKNIRIIYNSNFRLLQESEHQHHLKGSEHTESNLLSYSSEQFEGVDTKELIAQLKDVETLHEQADIIHYLFISK